MSSVRAGGGSGAQCARASAGGEAHVELSHRSCSCPARLSVCPQSRVGAWAAAGGGEAGGSGGVGRWGGGKGRWWWGERVLAAAFLPRKGVGKPQSVNRQVRQPTNKTGVHGETPTQLRQAVGSSQACWARQGELVEYCTPHCRQRPLGEGGGIYNSG